MGGAVTIPQCNSSILAGTISVIAPKNIYLQVRDVTGSIIYETKSGFLFPFSDPCLNPATLLYTQSFGVGLPPSTSQFKVMVTSPINTVPAP